MKYKRSFIFVRPVNDIAFYSDTVDFVAQLRAVIPVNIDVTSGRQGTNCEYVSFWFPEFVDYEWFTENLYVSGELKQVFRNAMIYAKTNRFAFCLPSVNLQNAPTVGITRYWYYNIKPVEEKLYDATPGQKKALTLLTHIMSNPDSVHSVTIFDFDHNIKFTENAFKNSVTPITLRKQMLRMEKTMFNGYSRSKDEFNKEHNIISFTHFDCVDRVSSKFTLDDVKQFVPAELRNLVLDLEI